MPRPLVVSRGSWHYRLYAWWRRTAELPEREPSDLCHYAKALAVYLPATLLVMVVVYPPFMLGFAVAAFVRKSRRARRLGAWLDARGPWIASLAAVACATWVLFLAFRADWAWTLVALACLPPSLGLVAALARWRGREGAGAARLAWEYAKARKRRVCPLIEVR